MGFFSRLFGKTPEPVAAGAKGPAGDPTTSSPTQGDEKRAVPPPPRFDATNPRSQAPPPLPPGGLSDAPDPAGADDAVLAAQRRQVLAQARTQIAAYARTAYKPVTEEVPPAFSHEPKFGGYLYLTAAAP